MFAGKTIIITGASSGLGEALAVRLRQRGAALALVARTEKKLEEVKERLEIIDASGCKIEIFPCDVTDAAATGEMADAVAEMFGLPDILINSAGILKEGYFEELPLSAFKQVFEVNYFGLINCIKSVLPYFKKKGSGRIVNIASLGGKAAAFGYTAYCSSKFALVGLSDTLRMELKPQNIMVNLVCPGEFESPMVDELNTYRTVENRTIAHIVPVLSVDVVADTIVEGIENERYLIVPGKMGKLTELINRCFPSILQKLSDYKISKVYRGPQDC